MSSVKCFDEIYPRYLLLLFVFQLIEKINQLYSEFVLGITFVAVMS